MRRVQTGAAAVRVERPELGLEPAPVDQPGQAHQRVPRVHQVLQPRSEEVVLRRGRGLLRAHPGFDINEWAGLYAPAGTPEPVVNKAEAAARAALALPEVRQRLDQLGARAVGSGRQEFAAWLAKHRASMSELVQAAAIKPD